MYVQEEVIPIVAIGSGAVIAVIAITFGSIKHVLRERGREKSRREIAAYVAEGAITAEEGERLLNAGNDPSA